MTSEQDAAHCIEMPETELGQLALFGGDRAVVENRGSSTPHVLGHRLGDGAGLTEEQELPDYAEARGRICEGRERVVAHDQ